MKKENKLEHMIKVGADIRYASVLKIAQVVMIHVKHINSSCELVILYAVIDRKSKMLILQPFSPNHEQKMTMAGRVKRISVNSRILFQLVGDIYSIGYSEWLTLTVNKK